MASKAKAGKGIQVKRGDSGSPEAFNTIGEVLSNTRSKSAAEIDVTSYDSTAMESIPGLVDNGELSLEMNFVGSNTEQQGMEDDANDSTTRNYKIVLNDHATTPTTFSFSAWVKSFQVSNAGPNDVTKASATLRITGAVTVTYAPT